jgi:methylmalonyl-CoA mutase cobalamin-binding domain/chain
MSSPNLAATARGMRSIAPTWTGRPWAKLMDWKLESVIRRTPEQIVRVAIDEDVDVVGISILSGAHTVLVPRVRQLLDEAGASDILMVVGGVIPQEDIPDLEAIGVSKVFLSGTSVAEIAAFIQSAVTFDKAESGASA